MRVRNRYGELLRQWQTGNFSQLSVRRRGEARGSHYFWLATPSSFRHTAFAGSRDEAVFNSCVWYSLCKSCCKSRFGSHAKGGLSPCSIIHIRLVLLQIIVRRPSCMRAAGRPAPARNVDPAGPPWPCMQFGSHMQSREREQGTQGTAHRRACQQRGRRWQNRRRRAEDDKRKPPRRTYVVLVAS